jgi:hypothetical protein
MKREKRLTKKERKAIAGPRPSGNEGGHAHRHIHCVACGKHLEPEDFGGAMASAAWLRCEHKSEFAACVECRDVAQALLDEHDRTGQPVRHAAAWH